MHGRFIQTTMDAALRPWVATCEETRERMSAHLEGELHGREQKRVLRHLARCERCREVLRTLARAVEGLRRLGRSDAPATDASVTAAVADAIRRDGR